ncbi:MAG: glycosyltransferase family 2 protein [Acholeplasmatales bacterium]|nr:glycosyltransferase family 2 protein [Acholeplasmatales bacterium]
MFLDIIIPIYNTKERYLRCALDSIQRQKGISFNDVGVIVIDNDSKIKYEKNWFETNYPKLHINYIVNEKNIGPGASRQKAIDASSAKYVTLLDSDDELYSENSLAPILKGLSTNTINVLYTLMRQEFKKDGKLNYYDLSFKQYQSLHGVFFKKEYLVQNEIRFHDNLNAFDDTYFMGCLTANQEGLFVNNLTYVWKYIDDSETLSKNKYNYGVVHFEEMVNCYLYIYEYYKKYRPDRASLYMVQQLVECILFLESSFFDYEQLKDKKERYSKWLFDLYFEHKADFSLFNKPFMDKLIEYKKKEINYLSGSTTFSGDYYSFIDKYTK